MKRIVTALAAVLCALSAQALSVEGTVRDNNGNALPGVKVTDGFSIVRTAENGTYRLEAHPDAVFVYLTVPAGFEVQSRNSAPLFYRELDHRASSQTEDFELVSTGEDETRHEFFVWADVQVYNESELEYLKQAAADAREVAEDAGVPAFGISCGDLAGNWSSGMFKDIQSSCAESGFPFFALMGNHDFRYDASTNEESKTLYQSLFGPTYYSFDKGAVHYVVLDDVFYFVRHYMGYLEQSQLDWLKADLADVPEGRTVVLFMHIPTYSPAARRGDWKSEEYNKIVVNRKALYSILKPYNAHICSAHEHYAENFVIEDNLMEHVQAPLSGLFWNSLLSADGVPWGYYVYEVDGDSLSWYYKAVGRSRDEQFSAYRTGEDPMKPDCVVANVWNYDPAWKVEWSENGEPKGAMQQFAGWDRNIVDDVENRREKEFAWKYIGAGKTEHMFFAKPESTDSFIEIRVTDRFGREYLWNSDRRIYTSDNFSISSGAVEWNGQTKGPSEAGNFGKYGTVKGADRMETSLYNLAIEEMMRNIEADGTFRTGEKWAGVWTRDVSYSAILSLAHLEPEVVRTSLMKKVDRKGRIIQDTGTGGAWPCSTDREVWAIAAWEVYLETGDLDWLRQVYPIVKRSLEADLVCAFDPLTGLYRGESSFIDWRVQSYPAWMQPSDISQSECLGTNAVFYRTLRVMSEMASQFRFTRHDSRKYEAAADALRDAINSNFWMEDKGYYAQYTYGRNYRVLSPRAETLGESLCILWGIASEQQSKRILENVPLCEYGPLVFTPNITGQGSYHNNGIWPFVTSFWGKAAAMAGNRTALMHALASNTRAAAVFGSHMENMVASDGSVNTLLDSPRQLWSIAGYIGLFREVLLGLHYDTDGLHFKPCVPAPMKGIRTINGLKYRNMTLNISVFGQGDSIKSFRLDGNETEPFLSTALEGEHTVEISLCSDYYAQPESITVLPVRWDLNCPDAVYADGFISWSPVAGADSYSVLRNGEVIIETADTVYAAHAAGEYSIMALNDDGAYSFISEPLRVRAEENILPLELEVSSKLGSQAKLEFEVEKSGTYFLDFNYSNGNGKVSNNNKCSTRTLYVDRERKGAVVLPQRGKDWTCSGWSNAIAVELTAGMHTLELRYVDENINMNIETDNAQLHSVRITYKNQ